jgi:hypothetical protein
MSNLCFVGVPKDNEVRLLALKVELLQDVDDREPPTALLQPQRSRRDPAPGPLLQADALAVIVAKDARPVALKALEGSQRERSDEISSVDDEIDTPTIEDLDGKIYSRQVIVRICHEADLHGRLSRRHGYHTLPRESSRPGGKRLVVGDRWLVEDTDH